MCGAYYVEFLEESGETQQVLLPFNISFSALKSKKEASESKFSNHKELTSYLLETINEENLYLSITGVWEFYCNLINAVYTHNTEQ